MKGISRAISVAPFIIGLFPLVALAEIPDASGDCIEGLVETTPSKEFTPLEFGAVVRHHRTDLEWQRCALGMDWNGTGCSGTAVELTWQEALNEARDGWRLPSVQELRTIMERCRRSPAVNPYVFPNTAPIFWSHSPDARDSDRAWMVFANQAVGAAYPKVWRHNVRLVRDGQ
jgi:hypothetical protein